MNAELRFSDDPAAWKRAYSRDWRRGIRRPVVKVPPEIRMLRFTDRLYGDTPSWAPQLGPCWPWTGARNGKGYGIIKVDGKPYIASRFALETALGRKLKPGMLANHHCDVKHCVRPRHLYEGTNHENWWDQVEHGSWRDAEAELGGEYEAPWP